MKCATRFRLSFFVGVAVSCPSAFRAVGVGCVLVVGCRSAAMIFPFFALLSFLSLPFPSPACCVVGEDILSFFLFLLVCLRSVCCVWCDGGFKEDDIFFLFLSFLRFFPSPSLSRGQQGKDLNLVCSNTYRNHKEKKQRRPQGEKLGS